MVEGNEDVLTRLQNRQQDVQYTIRRSQQAWTKLEDTVSGHRHTPVYWQCLGVIYGDVPCTPQQGSPETLEIKTE